MKQNYYTASPRALLCSQFYPVLACTSMCTTCVCLYYFCVNFKLLPDLIFCLSFISRSLSGKVICPRNSSTPRKFLCSTARDNSALFPCDGMLLKFVKESQFKACFLNVDLTIHIVHSTEQDLMTSL